MSTITDQAACIANATDHPTSVNTPFDIRALLAVRRLADGAEERGDADATAALNAIADDVAGIESVTAGAPAVARLIVNAVRAGGESGAWIHVGNYAASRRLAINTPRRAVRHRRNAERAFAAACVIAGFVEG